MFIACEISSSGDPSDNNQSFKDLKINILCYRYWWFSIWKCQKMSFPFGVSTGTVVMELMYIMKAKPICCRISYTWFPPGTAYSGNIENSALHLESPYYFKGGRIHSHAEEKQHLEQGYMLHFLSISHWDSILTM